LALTHREYARVREFLLILTKRRGQLKKPITDMVQWGQAKVESMPSREEKIVLLDCVNQASDGKMFLEREYSQIVKAQALMLEEDGKPEEATKHVQEI